MKKIYLIFAFLTLQTLSFAQQHPACDISHAEETCDLACIDCNFGDVSGSTGCFSGDGAVGFCSGIQNDQWYGFIAGASVNVTFTLSPSGCLNNNGVQIALYSDCNSGPLACDGGGTGQGNTPTSITAGLTEGQTYFLVIDGFGADVCDFGLSVSPSSAVRPPTVRAAGPIIGRGKVCPGATVMYTITPAQSAQFYTWTIPADATINGQSGPGPITFEGAEGTNVEITFGNSGGNISVLPSNACRVGAPRIKPVIVAPIPPLILPSVNVCLNEFPYQLPWGDDANNPGTFNVVLMTPGGCDSMVRIRVVSAPDAKKDLGKFTFCTDDSLIVCGKTFSLPGIYAEKCQTWKGCDSVVTFVIERPEAEIIGGGSLNCFGGKVLLRSGNTNGTKIWKNASGQVIATNDTLQVTAAGKYTLEVTDTLNGNCIKSKDIIIKDNDTLKLVLAQPIAPITCAAPISAVKVASNMPATFLWPGAGTTPLVSNTINTSTSGSFILTATTPGGCTATVTGMVGQDVIKPQITAMDDTLSCKKNATTLHIATNVLSAQYKWSGPNAFSSTKLNPVVTSPGIYEVTVTSPSNGCTNTATIEIKDEFGPHIITAIGGTLTCAQPTLKLALQVSSNIANPTFLWTGPNGFTSTLAEPVVSVPGNYAIVATNPLNGCTRVSAVMVMSDNQPFTPPAGVGGILNCINKSVVLKVPSLPPNYTYQWAGPGGFTSNQPMPVATLASTYTVTVKDPANGCMGTTTAVVTTDLTVPIAQAVGGTLPCKPPVLTLTCNTNTPQATFQWSGPNGFSSTLQTPVVSRFGTYRVTVTNSNSACTNTAKASVNENPGAPYASLSLMTLVGNIRRINCNTTAFNPTFAWSGPSGYVSAVRNPVVVLPGVYTVLIKDGLTGCETYRSITVPSLITTPGEGVENRQPFAQESNWNVYPNPAGTTVWLSHEINEAPMETRIQILDATGRLVWEQSVTDEPVLEVNVANTPSGLYRLLFVTAQGVETKALVIQR